MAHEPRLTGELRALLHTQRTAALGTTGDDGAAFVSMVPFALEPTLACLVIHVSGLAAHTRRLVDRPRVSLLVMQSEVPGQPVHALPRVTLEGEAGVLRPDSPPWLACRAAYLARFPEAAFLTQLGDFRFVAVQVTRARHVAGFGSARDVDREEVQRVMGLENP
ncbi:MAG: pyridoxamine 5'-phosphate oxidase [Burkholderiaceae bacterium]|nr:MAG: pyridoxamine 5'-phosphate oxidase [Burkholderiaceae bacterium]TBR75589.1 MAG: pyridoxamine 5'-phosphate oxidase [Burkholderiaceae bacterium]